MLLRLDEPYPDQRIENEGEGGRAFRPIDFPRLGILAAEELLGVSERVLDRPPS